jgi:hypothetical protein
MLQSIKVETVLQPRKMIVLEDTSTVNEALKVKSTIEIRTFFYSTFSDRVDLTQTLSTYKILSAPVIDLKVTQIDKKYI